MRKTNLLVVIFFSSLIAGCVEYLGTTEVSTSGVVVDTSGHPIADASVGALIFQNVEFVWPLAFAKTATTSDGHFALNLKHESPYLWSIFGGKPVAVPSMVCAACQKGTVISYFDCAHPGSRVVLHPWVPFSDQIRRSEYSETLLPSGGPYAVMRNMLMECESSPLTFSTTTWTKVDGDIIDAEGKPIASAVVHAVRILGVVGAGLVPGKSKVLEHDRFVSDASGHYSGQLHYHDNPFEGGETYGGIVVIYYACHNGYFPMNIPFPSQEGMMKVPSMPNLSKVFLPRGDEKTLVKNQFPSGIEAILNAPVCK
jgi:hypothetical protein